MHLPLRSILSTALVALAGFSPSLQAINFTLTETMESSDIGPGEMHVDGTSVYALGGHRIHKSTDGTTWTKLPDPPVPLADRLAVDDGRLSVIAGERILTSTDDGASWTDITGSFLGDIQKIHAGAGKVFIDTFEFVDGQSIVRLYRWDGAGSDYTLLNPGDLDGINTLVEAGSNLCLSARNSGLLWSPDAGDTWNSASGVSGNVSVLGVSPDGSTVLSGNVSNFPSISRSTNSCQSFSFIGRPEGKDSLRSLGIDGNGNFYAGFEDGRLMKSAGDASFVADNSGALPEPSMVGIFTMAPLGSDMLIGTGGLGVLSNASGDWAQADDGLTGAFVRALIPRDSDADAIGAALRGGYVVSDDAGAIDFAASNTGLTIRDVNDVLRIDANTLLAGTRGRADFSTTPATGDPGLFRSTDDGANWDQVAGDSHGLPVGADIRDLATDGSTLFAHVEAKNNDKPSGVYTSSDDGLTWNVTTLKNVFVRNLAARGSTVWAYISNDGVSRTTDGGATWAQVNNGLNGLKFGKIFATDSALIASAGGKTVYFSTDDGDNWQAASGFALSKFGIELLSMAEDADGVVYLGDEHAGLSISTDGGQTWTPDSDGLPQAEVCIPRIQSLLAKNGKIYAGTGGSGLFIASALGGGTPGDSVACTTDTDRFPDSFTLSDVINVEPDTPQISNTITVRGIDSGVTVDISVEGGEYSIGCDTAAFTAMAGTVGSGDTVCVRHTSASTSETRVTTILNIGNQSGDFDSITGLVFNGNDDEINTGFGNNGFANSPANAAAEDLLLTGDGSIVLGGFVFNGGQNDFEVSKLGPSGAVDTSFGSGGLFTQNFGNSEVLVRVLEQADGKLIAFGYQRDADNKGQIFAIRLNADGTLDTGYGTDGVVRLNTNPDDDSRLELVGGGTLLSDGTLLVVGSIGTSSNGIQVFAVKFGTTGAVDTTFGVDDGLFADGVAHVKGGNSSNFIGAGASSVVELPDGKLLIGARELMVRLNADGTADTSFGPGSDGTAPVTQPESNSNGLMITADGKIVIAGRGIDGNQFVPAVSRFNADGTQDTTFGDNGSLLISEVTFADVTDAALLDDGRIAIVGIGRTGNDDQQAFFSIVNADGTLNPDFGTNGYVLRGPVAGAGVFSNAIEQRADGGVVVGGAFDNDAAAFVFGGAADGSGSVDDTTPDPFDFTDVTDVEPSSQQTSDTVTIAGIDAPASLSILDGEYSLNGGAFTAADTSVSAGDQVQVRHTASGDFATVVTTTLTVGGVSGDFSSTTRNGDTMPDAFAFTDRTSVDLSSVIQSDTITVAGVEVDTTIEVTGGEYSIGCDSAGFTTDFGTIANGQTVCVRHTSSSSEETATNTTLDIGGVTDTFTSTTRGSTPLDTTPDVFSFNDVTDVEPDSEQVSNAITVSGIEADAQISITNGEYSIGCDPAMFNNAAGTIGNGDTVCVRHTAASAFNATTHTTLEIGGVSDAFSSTTHPDPASGDSDAVDTPSGEPANVASSSGLIENLTNTADAPAGSTPPAGVAFDDGYFAFNVTNLAAGGSTTVTITLPAGSAPDTYYKVNGGTFTEFLFDGTDGAQISGNVITLTLVDGGRGDADGTANGVIVDPGAPGSTSGGNNVSATVSSGGSMGWMFVIGLGLTALLRRIGRVALGAALLGAVSSASAQDWQVGGRVGGISHSLKAAEFEREMAKRGHNVNAQLDDSSVGAHLYVGMALTPRTDVEAGWIYTGETDVTVNGSSTNPEFIPEDAARLLSGRGHGLWLGLRQHYDLGGPRWEVVPRLGLVVVRGDFDVTVNGSTTSVHESSVGLAAGLGVHYWLVPNFSLGLNADLQRFSSENSGLLAAVTAEWRVGH